MSPTSTSLPCFPSRYHAFLSFIFSRSAPLTYPLSGSRVGATCCTLAKGSCTTCKVSSLRCLASEDSTSGFKPMEIRSLLLSMSIVILSLKSPLMTLFKIFSRSFKEATFKELAVIFLTSSSVRSYMKSCWIPIDWMVNVFLPSSRTIPCDERTSCHFSLVKYTGDVISSLYGLAGSCGLVRTCTGGKQVCISFNGSLACSERPL